MDLPEIKRLISKHRKSRDIQDWILLESYIKDKSSCDHCEGPIYYKNSNISLNKSGNLTYSKNTTTCKSFKEINGVRYYLKVCEKCMTLKFLDYIPGTRIFNVMTEMSKYAFKISDEISKEFTKTIAITLENLVKKHGKEEGEKIWENYKKLQAESNSFEYKKKKYGWDKKKFDEYNRSRAVTLENLSRKYGPEEGKKIFEGYIEKQRTNGNSLNWFIEKHGEEEGRKIFYRVLDEKAKGFLNSASKAYSEISQNFFERIDKSFSKKFTTYYQNKNKEYRIIIEEKEWNKVFYLDYYIEEIKVCIEFFGDYYHANPNKFKDPEQILKFRSKIKVNDIRKRDQLRIETLEKYLGIKTIIVWESDFNKNKNNPDFYKNVIKLCTERI
jgi:hypothetical protein